MSQPTHPTHPSRKPSRLRPPRRQTSPRPTQPADPADPAHPIEQPSDASAPPANTLPANVKTAWTYDEQDDLVRRSQSGDAAALSELRQAIARYPSLRSQLSDLHEITRQQIAESLLGHDNLLLRDTLDRQLAALRQELDAAARSPLERLLVERVLTCWTALHLAELAANTPPYSTFRDRRLDHAHHRYLASVQALARVSRLLAPSVAQINIATAGAQQLNVASLPDSLDP